jgi:hypothetical protein
VRFSYHFASHTFQMCFAFRAFRALYPFSFVRFCKFSGLLSYALYCISSFNVVFTQVQWIRPLMSSLVHFQSCHCHRHSLSSKTNQFFWQEECRASIGSTYWLCIDSTHPALLQSCRSASAVTLRVIARVAARNLGSGHQRLT